MTATSEDPQALRAAAADWLVRVQSDTATETDWLALETWLAGSPERRAAYEAVELLSSEIDDHADQLRASGPSAPPAAVVVPLPRPYKSRRSPAPAPVWAAAAAILVAVLIAWGVYERGPTSQVFATARGETRLVRLADGSSVELNSESAMTARVRWDRREITLDHGEAIFDVAKDPSHPFKVAVGDQRVTVVGTQFDILRHDGRITVTVSRGVVTVGPQAAKGSTAVRLTPGEQLQHREGAPTSTLVRLDAGDVLAWRRGYLVYRGSSLAQVAADLNRYFEVPIQVEGGASGLSFSGVLKLDSEDAVVRRLAAFLPIEVVREPGRIRLRSRLLHG
jgi:transmembrane sensor